MGRCYSLASLWRAQQPQIDITNALVLGLRRMKPEFRRRVDAWKAFAIASSHSPTPADDSATVPPNTPSQPDQLSSTAKRSSFEFSFRRWAMANGAGTAKNLRWIIAPSHVSKIRIKNFLNFVINCFDNEILEALTRHGVPQLTLVDPSCGAGRPDWKAACTM